MYESKRNELGIMANMPQCRDMTAFADATDLVGIGSHIEIKLFSIIILNYGRIATTMVIAR